MHDVEPWRHFVAECDEEVHRETGDLARVPMRHFTGEELLKSFRRRQGEWICCTDLAECTQQRLIGQDRPARRNWLGVRPIDESKRIHLPVAAWPPARLAQK